MSKALKGVFSMTDMTLAQFKESLQTQNERGGPDGPQFYPRFEGDELLGISIRFPKVHYSDVMVEQFDFAANNVAIISQDCVVIISDAASFANGIIELAVNARQETFAFFKVFRAVNYLYDGIKRFRYHSAATDTTPSTPHPRS